MKRLFIGTLIVASGSACFGAELPRSSPEAQGVDSSTLLSFLEAADKTIDSLHSFMLVRHGHVVAEGWWVPYNTSATYMLSAIVQKAVRTTVLDYLKPRLFEPLGIERPTWETSPQGISTGGFGLSIRTEDIARFGQLYLQKGKWQGKQLVPEL